MDNWDDLKILLALKRHGTMIAAATSLGINVTTISRRLDRCTNEFGETLFVRRGTIWEPTSAANPLIEAAEVLDQRVFPKIQSVDKIQRIVKVSIESSIWTDRVSENIGKFLDEYPNITLDLTHSEKSVAFGESDLRVGYQEPLEGRLIRVSVGEVSFRAYVNRDINQEPNSFIEVVENGRSGRRQSVFYAELEQVFGLPAVITEKILWASEIVRSWPVVVYLPTRYADRKPWLRPWKPNVTDQNFQVWATFHESRRLDPDIRIALNFIQSCF